MLVRIIIRAVRAKERPFIAHLRSRSSAPAMLNGPLSFTMPSSCACTASYNTSVIREISPTDAIRGQDEGKWELENEAEFHDVSDAALENIMDFLAPLEESLGTPDSKLEDAEMDLAQGVLNLKLTMGEDAGRYSGRELFWVINKQTPNRQLWWSSPLSGPRRYEYEPTGGTQNEEEYAAIRAWKYLKEGGIPDHSAAPAASNDMLHQLRQEILEVTGMDLK